MRRNPLFIVGMHLALLTAALGCTPVETRHPSASPGLDHGLDQPTAKRADSSSPAPTNAGQGGLATQSAQTSGRSSDDGNSSRVEEPIRSRCTGRLGNVYKYRDHEGKIYFNDAPLDGLKYTLEWVRETCRPVIKDIQLTANQIAAIKKRVGNHLKDPYSAKYHSIKGVSVKSGASKTTMVCGQVNAKNSFGGYVGKTPFFGYFTEAGAFYLENMSGDPVYSRSTLEKCLAWGMKFDL